MLTRKKIQAEADRGEKTLEELGLKVNHSYEIVWAKNGKPIRPKKDDEYTSDHIPRENEIDEETLRSAVRKNIDTQLLGALIEPVYLYGENGTEVSRDKPNAPHMTIFATKRIERERNVIIVVGEHDRDPTIFNWNATLYRGGMEQGTILGIVNRAHCKYDEIRKRRRQRSSTPPPTDAEVEAAIEKVIRGSGEKLDDPKTYRRAPTGPVKKHNYPAMIVLAPGQRTYSHMNRKTTTQAGWLARNKGVNQANAYEIDTEHNLVEGHKKPEEHVNTFFEKILANFVHPQANLFIIAIGDGAENVLSYMDTTAIGSTPDKFCSRLKQIALLGSTHRPSQITSITVQKALEKKGIAWALSDHMKGLIIGLPYPEQVHKSVKRLEIDEDDDDGLLEEYASIVSLGQSCVTKSAGRGSFIGEDIFPLVVDEIMDRFYEAGAFSYTE